MGFRKPRWFLLHPTKPGANSCEVDALVPEVGQVSEPDPFETLVFVVLPRTCPGHGICKGAADPTAAPPDSSISRGFCSSPPGVRFSTDPRLAPAPSPAYYTFLPAVAASPLLLAGPPLLEASSSDLESRPGIQHGSTGDRQQGSATLCHGCLAPHRRSTALGLSSEISLPIRNLPGMGPRRSSGSSGTLRFSFPRIQGFWWFR